MNEMGDCDDTLRELEAFLDHELSNDAHGTIRSHLDGCPDCLQAFDFQAELKLLIARKCREDVVPPGLLARLERCFETDFDGDGAIG